MNEPSNDTGKNEPSQSFFRRLFNKRGRRRLLIVLAWIVTLIALFYAEENWRGHRAWNKVRRGLEERGELVHFAAFIPKPIPDDQNFAATPVVQSWFVKDKFEWQDHYQRAAELISDSEKKQLQRNAPEFLDLMAWQMALEYAASHGTNEPVNRLFTTGKLDRPSRAQAAPAILEALKTNDTIFAELRVASQKPRALYPVNYELEDPWGILLPHLSPLRTGCLRLQLKVAAELALGRNDEASADVILTLSLADTIKDEPTLISHLVRGGCVQFATQSIWEGLAQHAWSDSQLQTFQSRLQSIDLIGEMQWPLAAERAAGFLTFDLLRQNGVVYLVDIGGAGSPTQFSRTLAKLAGFFIPTGWYYLEQVNYSRLHQLLIEGTFDPLQKTVSPRRIKNNMDALQREMPDGRWSRNFLQHKSLSAILLPALGRIPLKSAVAQTAANQAAIACGLERFRLARGQFPETLGELVPQFISSLPHDTITGEPYKYRRIADQKFVLYSVGWNGEDDGGTPGKKLFDETEGDWVW
jgi:hypothetical protein